jgi:hypothetical protein
MFISDVHMCGGGAHVRIRRSDQMFRGVNGCADGVQTFRTDIQRFSQKGVLVFRSDVQSSSQTSVHMVQFLRSDLPRFAV